MAIDEAHARKLLRDFNFPGLFVEELGWDKHKATLSISIDNRTFELSAVAEKRGMAAFVCECDGALPDYNLRRKVERQVAKSAREHFIIFTDAAKTRQIWQWVKREPGKPDACREHHFDQAQNGEALIQKLQHIAFGLEEEPNVTLVDVTIRARAGFDVEKVTKRFYERFQRELAAFLKFIQGIPDDKLERWYTSVMLNRLMFIYFIQKKGFLNKDINYLRNKLAASKLKDRYFSHFLCPLFFEGFAKKAVDRSAVTNELLGQVPYLNGGLFLRHEIESRHSKTIQIPDAAFARIFGFFDAYDWVLDPAHCDLGPQRSVARETKDEISPEILGYIFEKYINQKQMGAYYTKEDITEYISKNTVLPFLFDAARPKCKIAFDNPNGPTIWDLLKANPDRYIYPAIRHSVSWNYIPDHLQKGWPLAEVLVPPADIAVGLKDISKRGRWNKAAPAEFALPTEIWREVVARRQRCEEIRKTLGAGEVRGIKELTTLNLDIRQFAQDVIENCEGPELLRAFWHAIEKITILDPACGSGAFLFAALNVLEPLYEACLDRMAAFIEEVEQSDQKHRHEKFSDFRKVLDRVAAHPNRRYFIFKTIILNNLFGVDIIEEGTEICKLRLFLKLVAQIDRIEQIEPLPDIDFNIRAGNALVGYSTQAELETVGERDLLLRERVKEVIKAAEGAGRAYDVFIQSQVEGDESPPELKRRLIEKFGHAREQCDRFLAESYCMGMAENSKSFVEWKQTHQPFHWFVDFYGIMSKGGFDTIIGNPPYVEYKQVKKTYQVKGFATAECENLFAFFFERCISLGNGSAKIGMIIPVASVCTDAYATLQQTWLASGTVIISNFNDRPGKLFEGLEHIRLAIVLLNKSPLTTQQVYTTRYNKWNTESRSFLFQLLGFVNVTGRLRHSAIPKLGNPLEVDILERTNSQKRCLQNFVSRSSPNEIYYTRKLSGFVQILNFVPSILDSRGHKRQPSELKSVAFPTAVHRDVFLAVLNSSLFYWFLTVWSDCRNLNKREVYGVPFDFDKTIEPTRKRLAELGTELATDFRRNSKMLEINYEKWGQMKIQCIYPKYSKSLIDKVDAALAKHYGFTEEELDFITNFDIKYRMGLGSEGGEQFPDSNV
jgi:hypothetical protein